MMKPFYSSAVLDADAENDLYEPMLVTAKPLSMRTRKTLDDDDDEEVGIPRMNALDEEDETEFSEEEDACFNSSTSYSSVGSWCDSMIWFILLALMCSDFGVTFMTNPEATATLHVGATSCSLIMFMISAYFYRKTVQEWNNRSSSCCLAEMLPDVCMIIVPSLLLANNLWAAFVALNASIIILSTIVVSSSLFFLFGCFRNSANQSTTKEQAHDDDDFSWYQSYIKATDGLEARDLHAELFL